MFVEGELGKIAGKEDGLDVSILDGKMTDPEQAKRFVIETQVCRIDVARTNSYEGTCGIGR